MPSAAKTSKGPEDGPYQFNLTQVSTSLVGSVAVIELYQRQTVLFCGQATANFAIIGNDRYDMSTFDDLVSLRKAWISDVLTPWCKQACRADLLKAEPEWLDIAGKVPTEKTLWVWAWSRFPELVHESLGIEETTEVEVRLKDGRSFIGFPDSRRSVRGQLVVWLRAMIGQTEGEAGPFSIDDIDWVQKRQYDD